MANTLKIDTRLRSIIKRIVLNWKPTLDGDGAVDVEDLEQDLLFRCWGYVRANQSMPSPNLMRNWARAAMRSYGYAGANARFLKSKLPTLTPSQLVEYVGQSVGPENTVIANDEDYLDYLYFHYGLQRETEHEQALREEHSRLFWDLIQDRHALAAKVDDIGAVKVGEWDKLAREWGYKHRSSAKAYAEGELRDRISEIDVGGALFHLQKATGRAARMPAHYQHEFDSGKRQHESSDDS